jgi:hypothetical protein
MDLGPGALALQLLLERSEIQLSAKEDTVFGPGAPDLDLMKSPHFPGPVSISFFSEDIQAARLRTAACQQTNTLF